MSEARPERRLAAILATDVAGYSRLMGSNEEATLARLNTLHQGVIYPAIAEYRGRVIKTMGDGLLAEFASAVDAVRCAVVVQRGTRAFNLDLPVEQQLHLRVGVNIGDLIYQGSDVFGDGVNIAARLQSIAEVDGVFVSQPVRDYVREEASFIFDDLGPRSLKNIDRPVRVYRVRQPGETAEPRRRGGRRTAVAGGALVLILAVASGTYWYFERGRVAAPSPSAALSPPAPAIGSTSQPTAPTTAAPASGATAQPVAGKPAVPAMPSTSEPRFSLVLLPLRADDDKDRFLADGVTERLIGALGRLPDGLVIARETTMAVRGRGTDPKGLAAELGVRYLVQGTIARDASGVHLAARLVDGRNGENVWGGHFDHPGTDMAAAEAELLTSLAGALGAGPDGVRQAVGALPPAAGAELDDLVLQGWDAAYRPASAGTLLDAQALFQKVLASDSGNLEAALGLAFIELRLIVGKPFAERRAHIQHADELLTRVLDRRPDDERALQLKAEVLIFDAEPERALELLDRALAINPSFAEAWGQHAGIDNRSGRLAESILRVRQAIRLSPHDPARGLWLTVLGADEFATGDTAAALADLRKASEANPRLALPYLWLAAVAAHSGDTPQAKAALNEYLKREPGMTIARLKQTRTQVGVTDGLLDGLRMAGMAQE